MALRILPKEDGFADLFAACARQVQAAARELSELLGAEPEEYADIADRMRDIEGEASAAARAVLVRLGTSFVTPFDRADIHGLATGLADCVEHMEGAVDLIALYDIDELPRRVEKQISIVARMADLTAEAMPRLRNPRALAGYWTECQRLEHQADKKYRRVLAELFNAADPDVILVMKLKQVVDELEAAANALADVALRVEAIAVKES